MDGHQLQAQSWLLPAGTSEVCLLVFANAPYCILTGSLPCFGYSTPPPPWVRIRGPYRIQCAGTTLAGCLQDSNGTAFCKSVSSERMDMQGVFVSERMDMQGVFMS
jgi:hypothetical protein